VNLSRLVVGTFNRAKAREMTELLQGLAIEVLPLSAFDGARPVEETGQTFEANALMKAEGLARQIGEWVVADDSGLEVDALGGRPGVFSARYGGEGLTDADRCRLLLDELKDTPSDRRAAQFRCVVALSRGGQERIVTSGAVEGRIALAPAGGGGFGYDPVFVPTGYDRSFGELGTEVKHRISHRAEALTRFREELARRLER